MTPSNGSFPISYDSIGFHVFRKHPIDMERDYRWELNGPDDEGGDGGDGGDGGPRSTRESPPPDLAA